MQSLYQEVTVVETVRYAKFVMPKRWSMSSTSCLDVQQIATLGSGAAFLLKHDDVSVASLLNTSQHSLFRKHLRK